MESKLISVIVPIYNVEPYLRRCVDSILNQSYSNLEIILINDGSPDGCPSICDEYALLDSRVRVIHKANGGVSSARNAGLDIASGDFIGFVDPDDWIHPDYFLCLSDVLASSGKKIAGCKPQHATNYSDNFPAIIHRSYTLVPNPLIQRDTLPIKRFVTTKLYSKDSIGDVRFHCALSYAEDTLFNYEVLCRQTDEVAFFSEPMYYYFQRYNSAVHSASCDEKAAMITAYLAVAANAETTSHTRSVFLTQSAKEIVAHRYLCTFEPNYPKIAQDCVDMFSQCIHLQKEYGSIDRVQWVILRLLYYFPSIYRLIRIALDPTMLTWERNQKQKNKEENT